MMPIVSNTQIQIPTQPSMVATALPGATSTVRPLPDAVAPSVSSGAIGPDAKGNGVYVAPATAPAAAVSPLSPLTVTIPASFTTNAASLSADAVYAAQALSQDPAIYETMVANSEVKYKPSNATAPEPAPNNLFAKMLAQEQSHTQPAIRNVTTAVQASQTQTQAPAPKAALPASRKSEPTVSSGASERTIATHAYSVASVRHKALQGDDVEETTPVT